MRMTRSTLMPDAAARPGLSLMARVALPMRVRSSQYATAISRTMLIAIETTSIQESAIGPMRMSRGAPAPGSW